MRLQLDHYESPLGTILLAIDDDGALRALDFVDYESRMRRLLRDHYGEYELRAGSAPSSVTQALDAYFDGNLDALDKIRVETNGTPFQRQVWQALRTISAGSDPQLRATCHPHRSSGGQPCRRRGERCKPRRDHRAVPSRHRGRGLPHRLRRRVAAQTLVAGSRTWTSGCSALRRHGRRRSIRAVAVTLATVRR